MFKKLKNANFLYFLILISALLILFIFFWKNQLKINYLDYAEGYHLYETHLLLNGKKPYQDFFLPQPPVLFYIGYFLLKIYNRILTIKIYLFLIFILSSIFTYFIFNKVFKNKLFSFFSLFSTFLLTITIFRWPTFTTETTLRFFITLFVFIYVFISDRYFYKKYLVLNFLLILMFFTKYTSGFFVFFFYLFFILRQDLDKNRKINYLLISFFNFLLSLILIYIFFGFDFFYQTVIIRNILSLKPKKILLSSTFYYLIKFFPFYFINLYLGLKKFFDKKYHQSFVFLVSFFWLPNLIFNFFEGTYLYIFYPIENFLLTGFFYLILNINSFKKKNLVKLILLPLIFWSLLVLIYQSQIFIDNHILVSNKNDLLTTQKLIKEIKIRKEEKVIAPPYFLFMAEKNIYDNFHDPFFVLYYLLKKDKERIFETTIKSLKENKPQILFVDWRIESTLLLLDKNYFKDYKKTQRFLFLNNQSEQINVYKKIN